MSNKNHIVDFSSKKAAKPSQALRSLPLMVEEARNVCLKALDSQMKKMLEQADDYLFDMAESGYNNAHFDAMRMLRLKKDSLIRNFQQEIKKSFSEHLGKQDIASQENEEQVMSFENIALVEEGDLEEGIAIDGIVKKARNANVDALEKIRTRLDTLIPHQSVSKENNPFEPAFICAAFRQASLALDIDIQSMLVIYKLFERMVMSQIPHTLADVNQFFCDKGVLPELKVTQYEKTPRTSSTAYDESTSIDDLLGINSEPASTSQADDKKIVSLLQGLLAQRRGVSSETSQAQAGGGSLNEGIPSLTNFDMPVVETTQLVSALTNLQASTNLAAPTTTNIVADLRNQLGSQLNAPTEALQQGALGQFNDDMIDIVSMLFDFILDDKNVHVEIKSVIGRLQIPMLKVGLVDRSFFSNKKHPARILLNEIARAGISWDPSDVEAARMLQKIEAICDSVNNDFQDDVSIFDHLLKEFETFRGQIQKRSNIFERRTREAEEGKAKAETARGTVNNALEKICRGKHLPSSGRDLLKQVWVNVMFLEKLKDSQDGWDKVNQVAKLLVWSLQPINSAPALEKLISRIPILIKNLRKGFDIISLSPLDATRLLEELETSHRQIIKSAQEQIENLNKPEEVIRLAPAPLIPESTPSDADSPNQQMPDIEAELETEVIEAIEIQEIGFSSELTGVPLNDETRPQVELNKSSVQAVERLSAGHWVELTVDGSNSRCKLAARISSSGKYIFVNRSGVKIAEFFTEDLAAEYQLGRLKILDDEALFDRALESVISNLRSMKSEF